MHQLAFRPGYALADANTTATFPRILQSRASVTPAPRAADSRMSPD